jgi:acetoin utilization protein AcuB
LAHGVLYLNPTQGEQRMKQMPRIEKVMTTQPHSIGRNMPIKKALELMTTHQIRHLPVQDGGNLVGVITDRDIRLANGFQGAETLIVDDVMTPDAYVVKPTTPIDQVVEEMAEHKYGCAVISQNGKVVGILTAVDALRFLSDVLRENYKVIAS